MKIMASNPITSWQIDRETMETVFTLLSWAPKSLCMVNCSHKIKKMHAPWKGSYDKPRQHIRKQRYYFAHKNPSSQVYGFSSSHVWMWELDHKEGWVLKDWCFWIVVLEKTLESPLDCNEISNQSILKEVNSIFTGRTGAEAGAPIPDAKNRLLGKDPEDEIVEWHHWLNGHEFEQALGVGDGQGSLVCCSPWDHKGSDTTEWLDDNSSVLTLKLKCNM